MTEIARDDGPVSRGVGRWIRQSHRWLSIIFTLSVIATFIALALPEPLVWVSYLPLVPLFLLMGTGLYMFASPYVVKWRGRSSAW